MSSILHVKLTSSTIKALSVRQNQVGGQVMVKIGKQKKAASTSSMSKQFLNSSDNKDNLLNFFGAALVII